MITSERLAQVFGQTTKEKKLFQKILGELQLLPSTVEDEG